MENGDRGREVERDLEGVLGAELGVAPHEVGEHEVDDGGVGIASIGRGL